MLSIDSLKSSVFISSSENSFLSEKSSNIFSLHDLKFNINEIDSHELFESNFSLFSFFQEKILFPESLKRKCFVHVINLILQKLKIIDKKQYFENILILNESVNSLFMSSIKFKEIQNFKKTKIYKPECFQQIRQIKKVQKPIKFKSVENFDESFGNENKTFVKHDNKQNQKNKFDISYFIFYSNQKEKNFTKLKDQLSIEILNQVSLSYSFDKINQIFYQIQDKIQSKFGESIYFELNGKNFIFHHLIYRI